MNQFYTLLHTTLKLSNQDDSPPHTPPEQGAGEPSADRDASDCRKLSPVVELSESASSTLTEQNGAAQVRGFL